MRTVRTAIIATFDQKIQASHREEDEISVRRTSRLKVILSVPSVNSVAASVCFRVSSSSACPIVSPAHCLIMVMGAENLLVGCIPSMVIAVKVESIKCPPIGQGSPPTAAAESGRRFMPASLPPAQRKCPSAVLVLRERRRACQPQGFNPKAGNQIVMRQKQIKSPPGTSCADCGQGGSGGQDQLWQSAEENAKKNPPSKPDPVAKGSSAKRNYDGGRHDCSLLRDECKEKARRAAGASPLFSIARVVTTGTIDCTWR